MMGLKTDVMEDERYARFALANCQPYHQRRARLRYDTIRTMVTGLK